MPSDPVCVGVSAGGGYGRLSPDADAASGADPVAGASDASGAGASDASVVDSSTGSFTRRVLVIGPRSVLRRLFDLLPDTKQIFPGDGNWTRRNCEYVNSHGCQPKSGNIQPRSFKMTWLISSFSVARHAPTSPLRKNEPF